MRAKDFFRQVINAESQLRQLKSRLRHYEDIGLTITSNGSGTGNGQRGTSRVELAAIGMVDATAHLIDEIKKYQSIVNRAEAVISRIPQEKYRQILTYKYLCGWSFRSISDELAYNDPNSIYRAHGWALAAAQRILDGRDSNGREAAGQADHSDGS
jgi:hypothetical protein